jgi:hypothetical protein
MIDVDSNEGLGQEKVVSLVICEEMLGRRRGKETKLDDEGGQWCFDGACETKERGSFVVERVV